MKIYICNILNSCKIFESFSLLDKEWSKYTKYSVISWDQGLKNNQLSFPLFYKNLIHLQITMEVTNIDRNFVSHSISHSVSHSGSHSGSH